MDYFIPTKLGSTPDEDYLLLAECAANLDFPADHVIVEIGSGVGKSTITMALVSQHKIVAIDPHDGPWIGAAGTRNRRYEAGNTLHEFIRNLRKFKVEDKVEIIQQYSDEVEWNGRPIAMLFHDGDHSFTSLRIEARIFHPHVVPGGYIVFHDYCPMTFPGIVTVADELLRSGKVELVEYYPINDPGQPDYYDPNERPSFGILVTRKCT